MIEKITVKGMENLERNLKELGKKVATKVVRAAIREGAKPMVLAARVKAPKRTGRLASSIRLSGTRVSKRTGTMRGLINTRVTKKTATGSEKGVYFSRKRTLRYAHLVIGGTDKHIIPGPVNIHGKIYENVEHPGAKPNPFFERAFDASAKRGLQAFTVKFGQRFDAEVLKLPNRKEATGK